MASFPRGALWRALLALPILPLLAGCAPEITVGPWRGLGEPSALYWGLVVLVGGGLIAFILWSLRAARFGGWLDMARGNLLLAALVLVLIVWTFVLYLVPALSAQGAEPSPGAWAWKPGETLTDPAGSGLKGEPYRGYKVFISQGCIYCHTGYVRSQDLSTGWAETATEKDVSKAGDYVNYPATLLGTQRNAPDLSLEGRRVSDMTFQINHFIEPRGVKPNSIMPAFRYLGERERRDLAAYLVSLGNDPAKLKAGVVVTSAPAASPLAAKGQELYREMGCVGCHSIDGSRRVGPTWKGLFGKEERLSDGSTVPVDEAYLRESMLSPGAKVVAGFPNDMPSFADRLSEDDIAALTEYIKSLK